MRRGRGGGRRGRITLDKIKIKKHLERHGGKKIYRYGTEERRRKEYSKGNLWMSVLGRCRKRVAS